MARQFQIPAFYRSSIISRLKELRRRQDHYKKDWSSAVLALGPIRLKIARHFGFCYGVENAIEIAYKAVAENPHASIYLLSEMIHNARVNADLKAKGISFLQKPNGESLIPIESLCKKDIVIIPAFGTTLDILERLQKQGVQTQKYNTTCPFVERVWKRAESLGREGYTVLIHGQEKHEETRATFSHAAAVGPTLMLRDIGEAHTLAGFFAKGSLPEIEYKAEWEADFFQIFAERYSQGFSPRRDLRKLGLVNQTTMLAHQTRAIGELLRSVMSSVYREDGEQLQKRFADTKDTLCYATAENQEATQRLLQEGGDLALVVGSYNSSNTSHLVELLESAMPVYYIQDAQEIKSQTEIHHLNLRSKNMETTKDWLRRRSNGDGSPIDILITAGASCPDALVDEVIRRLAALYGLEDGLESLCEKLLYAQEDSNPRPFDP